jgi:hypothetical protein
MPANGTDATIAPLRRQIEQSQRRGSTIPSGRFSSSDVFQEANLAEAGHRKQGVWTGTVHVFSDVVTASNFTVSGQSGKLS